MSKVLRWESPARGRKRRPHHPDKVVAETKIPGGADHTKTRSRVLTDSSRGGKRDGVGEASSSGLPLLKRIIQGDRNALREESVNAGVGDNRENKLGGVMVMHDVENSGPEKSTRTKRSRKQLTREKRREDDGRRRNRRKEIRRTNAETADRGQGQGKENREPRIVTWNIQRAVVADGARQRFFEVLQKMDEWKVDVMLLTEINQGEPGMEWFEDEDAEKKVVVYGKRAAVVLTGEWAEEWRASGSRRETGDRVVAVSVAGFRFVSCYWPVWYGPKDTSRISWRSLGGSCGGAGLQNN